jgi:late competence protein required for DNA uptake (superfamily II DNA/RNA helicase)
MMQKNVEAGDQVMQAASAVQLRIGHSIKVASGTVMFGHVGFSLG